MGGVLGRQNAGVEEVDIGVNHAYRYPPKQGNYFSNHFIMGGERFDTALPEMYLFGENMDLNFLGSRPAPFPYPAPTASEPSKTLKALINIRKESLRLVKVPEETHSLKGSEPVEGCNNPLQHNRTHSSDNQTESPPAQGFNIEFTFDSDVRCAITVMYFCTEEITTQGLVYVPRDPSMNSETYHYKRGANQQFSQSSHIFYPAQHCELELSYGFEREVCPVVVQCVAEEGEEPRQSQATIGIIERHSDGYVIKSLKQKLFVHGLCYLLQEIYGIENKNSEVQKGGDEDTDDNGAECVICMCDLRDTLILPCRHLCLCNCCADSLRYQANNCPICRAPFRALLQIKALQKSSGNNPPALPSSENSDVPVGYEAVSLIEALNGPSAAPPVQPNAPAYKEMYIRLNQNPGRGDAAHGSVEDSTTQTDSEEQTEGGDNNGVPLDGNTLMRMSVLLASQEGEGEGGRKRGGSKKRDNVRDTVKLVNEVSKQCEKQNDSPVEDIKKENITNRREEAISLPPCSPSPPATPLGETAKRKKVVDSDEEHFSDDTNVAATSRGTSPTDSCHEDSRITPHSGVKTKNKSKSSYKQREDSSSSPDEGDNNPQQQATSMPGTPLSNASDISCTSVNSNQALLYKDSSSSHAARVV